MRLKIRKLSVNKKRENYLLNHVLVGDGLEHILLAGFLHVTAQHELVPHEIGFLKVEYNVQLADLSRFKI